LLLGKRGAGKTAFLNCFFNSKSESYPINTARTEVITIYPFVHFTSSSKIEVRFIDAPGYTEANLEEYTQSVVSQIQQSYEKESDYWLRQRLAKHLDNFKDERIHLCLFFLTGPCIEEGDWTIMKRIEKITNLIPVISKGDHYTTAEVHQFKRDIEAKRREAGVNWLSVEEIIRQKHPALLDSLLESSFGKSPPFVIVSCFEREYSDQLHCFQLIRAYNWGTVELENKKHNDFAFLKGLLIYQLSEPLIRSTSILQRSYLEEKELRARAIRPQYVLKYSESSFLRFPKSMRRVS
jgi:septin family protein